MKALNNRFYVKFMQLEIGLLEIIYLEITLLMSKVLKHANYLNAVLKSLKTLCS